MSYEPDSLARSLELAHLELCWGTVERASLLEMIGVAGENGGDSRPPGQQSFGTPLVSGTGRDPSGNVTSEE